MLNFRLERACHFDWQLFGINLEHFQPLQYETNWYKFKVLHLVFGQCLNATDMRKLNHCKNAKPISRNTKMCCTSWETLSRISRMTLRCRLPSWISWKAINKIFAIHWNWWGKSRFKFDWSRIAFLKCSILSSAIPNHHRSRLISATCSMYCIRFSLFQNLFVHQSHYPFRDDWQFITCACSWKINLKFLQFIEKWNYVPNNLGSQKNFKILTESY